MTEFARHTAPFGFRRRTRTYLHVSSARSAGKLCTQVNHRMVGWEGGVKFEQEPRTERNLITRYGSDYVEINETRYTRSVIVYPDGPVVPWPPTRFEAFTADDFAALAKAEPELVLLGTGARLRFGHPSLYAALSAKRIGVETMDFSAACRTFNILVSDGRRAAAALLIEPAVR